MEIRRIPRRANSQSEIIHLLPHRTDSIREIRHCHNSCADKFGEGQQNKSLLGESNISILARFQLDEEIVNLPLIIVDEEDSVSSDDEIPEIADDEDYFMRPVLRPYTEKYDK